MVESSPSNLEPRPEAQGGSAGDAPAAVPDAQHPAAADIASLVRRSLSGELECFERLVAIYQRAVHNLAYYKSGNAADAEDLAQDIFLAAFKALPTLKDPEHFGAWIIGIAHNRCHKWFRRERTKVIKFKELKEIQEQRARLGWKSAPAGDDGAALLSEEILDLPSEISKVLVLKYLEGLSYEAIEARLGIKAYRIDYLIRKGKSLLKSRLRRRERDLP
jgi:RNA polymerase sigma-70 factor (ECF subfamily)